MKAIDLFAGLGGFTTGARQAGIEVLWACNHWPDACLVHALNHPDTQHACQDLHQADWSTVPTHDLLLASPACQGHSWARGTDRPHHDSARSTAWAVVGCAERHRPQFIVVENVPEFLRWALYPAWADALHRLGYSLVPHVVDAADHGVPQCRRRVFIIATRSRAPLHLTLPRRDHVAALAIVDFDKGSWSRVADKCPRTRARVRAGRREFGPRFLTAYYGSQRGGRSLHRPLGTVTTRARFALIDGPMLRMLTTDECRQAMAFPEGFQLPSNHRLALHMLGNAVPPPVACDILTQICG